MSTIHRNLLWLRGDPALLDQLLQDRRLARIIAARPAPGLCAVRREHHRRLVDRLAALDQVPRERGTW